MASPRQRGEVGRGRAASPRQQPSRRRRRAGEMIPVSSAVEQLAQQVVDWPAVLLFVALALLLRALGWSRAVARLRGLRCRTGLRVRRDIAASRAQSLLDQVAQSLAEL